MIVTLCSLGAMSNHPLLLDLKNPARQVFIMDDVKDFFKGVFKKTDKEKEKKFQGKGHVIGTKADEERRKVRSCFWP